MARKADLHRDLSRTISVLGSEVAVIGSRRLPAADLRRQIIARPWLAFGAAVAAGFLVGRATGRRAPRERRLDLPGMAGGAMLATGAVQFIGTATTIIRYGGFTILTDPNFLHAGDHVHLGYGLTSRRLTNPAVEIDALPPLDLCVLSHMHGDHWDRLATERLRKDLPVVTTHHAAASLRRQGFRATEALGTWDVLEVTKGGVSLRITALPATHGPGPLAAALPEVMGSLLEWSERGRPLLRMYISGDTLLHRDLREIPRRFPEIDLGLIHLGGTRLFGVLPTMDDRQGVEAVEVLQPREVLPIHYNDYPVFTSPVEDFLERMRAELPGVPVHFLRHGETHNFRVLVERSLG